MIWYGKDGKIYDNVNDKIKADNLWDQQERQNKLLEEQNRLLEEQRIADERNREEDRKNQIEFEKRERTRELEEIENRQFQRELEISRHEHDREMRLLNLCDSIGISKSIIDNYLKSFYSSIEIRTIANKLKKLENEKETKNNQILKKEFDPKTGYATNRVYNGVTPSAKIECYKKIKEMDQSAKYLVDDSFIEEAFEKMNTQVNHIIVVNVCGGILLCFSLYILDLLFSSTYHNVFLELIGFVVLYNIASIVYRLYKKSRLKNQIITRCDERLKQEYKEEDKYKQRKKIIKDNEEDAKKLEKEVKVIEEDISKLEKEKEKLEKDNIKKNLDELYDFRINHYNYEIEKFLLDYGFDNKYGINYKTIIKEEAKGFGEIRDYNDYFLKKINENKKK